jgi:hypothetical protein
MLDLAPLLEFLGQTDRLNPDPPTIGVLDRIHEVLDVDHCHRLLIGDNPTEAKFVPN